MVMCICKAANTSIKWALAEALGLKIENIYAPSNFEYTDKHTIAGLGEDWLIISIVRNPYTRLMSCWADKIMGDRPFFGAHHPEIKHHMPFKDFVDAVADIPDHKADQHIRAQTWDLCVDDRLLPHCVLPLEHIGIGWPWVRALVHEHCGLDLDSLPHCRETEIEVIMDDESKEKIRNRYARDFEVLEYNEE